MRPSVGRGGPIPRPKPDAGGDRLLKLVNLLWVCILCDPQWLLAEGLGLRPLLKVPTILTVVLAIAFFVVPRKGDYLWPVLLLIFATAANLPFSPNRGMSIVPIRQMCFYYLVGIGLTRAVRSPKEAGFIILIFCVVQFLWWGVNGVRHGLVYWHPNMSNYDSYGPMMAGGVGPAYFYGMGTKGKWRKIFAFIAAALCVIGVISSFARGAVLSLVATVGYIWLRSPNKGRTLGFLAAAGAVFIIAGSVINGNTRGTDTHESFWDEMMSSFDATDATAVERKALWAMAVKVFLYHPILGAGAENFGVEVTKLYERGISGFQIGDVGGAAAGNPEMLYGRALHNSYFQILSEFGLVGCILFLTILYQFWTRNRALLTPKALAKWREGGGIEDPAKIALGLESSMVAFLLTAYFYNQLFTPWLYAVLFLNTLLYQLVTRPGPNDRPRRLGQRRPPPQVALRTT